MAISDANENTFDLEEKFILEKLDFFSPVE